MTSEDQLCAVLDETTAALARLDPDGLLTQLECVDGLRSSGIRATGLQVAAKHQLLETMLRVTESNLNLLRRLHDRKSGSLWER